MKVDVQVTGLDEAIRENDQIARRLANPGEGLQRVAVALRAEEGRYFAAHGDGAWPALAASTIRRHGPHPPLVMTGRLLASLTGGARHKETIRGPVLTFGTNWPHANLVNGRRPIVSDSARTRRRLAEILTRYIVEDELL